MTPLTGEDAYYALAVKTKNADTLITALEVKRTEQSGKRLRSSARLSIRNLIPADFLAERFAQTQACILFSATLSPAECYQDLLGLPENTLWQAIPSPFSADQLDLQIININTRFNDRLPSIGPMVERIEQQYRSVPGNYLVYLSSFAYLEQLKNAFEQQCLDIPVIAQTTAMSEQSRLEFIDQFRTQRGVVGFAVLGGVFSEGIDLPGDALVGVFIATLGLPPFDDFHRQLAQRLQTRFGQGYAYTYLYPGHSQGDPSRWASDSDTARQGCRGADG